MLDKIALTLLIIGGINWGLVGLFQFDLVAWIGGRHYQPNHLCGDRSVRPLVRQPAVPPR